VIRHVSLFTGIGGFELAAQRVWGDEYEPVLFCEMDKFCQRVLNKHWPNVPIVEDVRDVKEGKQESGRRGITNSSENKKGDPKELLGSIDLLTGGFP